MALQRVSTTELKGNRLATPIYAHIAHWIRNPDPGSIFDKKTRWFRWLPIGIVTEILFLAGYEGLIFLDDNDAVVGHVFFQRHGDSLKAFHWYIQEEERGQGHMREISNAFFEQARSNSSISRVRIGAGGNDRIAKMWEHIRDGKIVPECGLRAGNDMGWLFFPERLAR